MNSLFNPLRALTRHNDPLLAAGINAALMDAPGIKVVTSPSSGSIPEAEVVICDYDSGMAWTHHHRFRASGAQNSPRVVVITWRDSESDVRAALQSGVGGYLLGSCGINEFVEAVRVVGRGSPYLCEVAAAHVAISLTRTPLTFRESEILRLMASGLSNKLIASELNIALGTVKSHAKAVLDKLGARSRTQATVLAAHQGLLGPGSPLRQVVSLRTESTTERRLPPSHWQEWITAQPTSVG